MRVETLGEGEPEVAVVAGIGVGRILHPGEAELRRGGGELRAVEPEERTREPAGAERPPDRKSVV